MRNRDHRGAKALLLGFVAILLLGTMLPVGATAQQATPVVTEPEPAATEAAPAAQNRTAALTTIAPTGTVTREVSNLTPSPGELVTFTVTISGAAPAGTRLALYNIFGNTQLEYKAFRVQVNGNLTAPDPAAYLPTSVLIQVVANGAYSATYQWDMVVHGSAGDTITSASQFQDAQDTFNVDATVNQTLAVQSLTGTITSSPSNPMPPAGELVTFTIAISGTGPAGTTLAVTTSFPAGQLTFEAFRTVSSSNLGTPSHLAGTGIDLITSTMPEGGSYSATFEIDMRVASSLANGTTIATQSNLGALNASEVDSAGATLTVTSMPGEPDPEPETPDEVLVRVLIAQLIAILQDIILQG